MSDNDSLYATASMGTSLVALQQSYLSSMQAANAERVASLAQRRSAEVESLARSNQRRLSDLQSSVDQAVARLDRTMHQVLDAIQGLRADQKIARQLDDARLDYDRRFGGNDWSLAKQDLKDWLAPIPPSTRQKIAERWASAEMLRKCHRHWLFGLLIHRCVVFLGRRDLEAQARELLDATCVTESDGDLSILFHLLEKARNSTDAEFGAALADWFTGLGERFEDVLPRRQYVRDLLEDCACGRYGEAAAELARGALRREWLKSWGRGQRLFDAKCAAADRGELVEDDLATIKDVGITYDPAMAAAPGLAKSYLGAVKAALAIERQHRLDQACSRAGGDIPFRFDAESAVAAILDTQLSPQAAEDPQYETSLRVLGLEILFECDSDKAKAARVFAERARPVGWVPFTDSYEEFYQMVFVGAPAEATRRIQVLLRVVVAPGHLDHLRARLAQLSAPESHEVAPEFHFSEHFAAESPLGMGDSERFEQACDLKREALIKTRVDKRFDEALARFGKATGGLSVKRNLFLLLMIAVPVLSVWGMSHFVNSTLYTMPAEWLEAIGGKVAMVRGKEFRGLPPNWGTVLIVYFGTALVTTVVSLIAFASTRRRLSAIKAEIFPDDLLLKIRTDEKELIWNEWRRAVNVRLIFKYPRFERLASLRQRVAQGRRLN